MTGETTQTGGEPAYPSYEAIVASWGFEVVEFNTFGYYQGDHAVLLRDGDRWGVTVFGYGSCSGCDALQDIIGYRDETGWATRPEVVELSDGLREAVQWFDSRAEMVAWLRRVTTGELASDDPIRWWFYETETKAWASDLAAVGGSQ